MPKNQISIRVSEETRERAKKLLEKMNETPTWKAIGLKDAVVLRMAIQEGLEVLEKRFT